MGHGHDVRIAPRNQLDGHRREQANHRLPREEVDANEHSTQRRPLPARPTCSSGGRLSVATTMKSPARRMPWAVHDSKWTARIGVWPAAKPQHVTMRCN